MTPTSPQPEYIITEEQLHLISMYANWSDTHARAVSAIRSRPTPSPQEVVYRCCEYYNAPTITDPSSCQRAIEISEIKKDIDSIPKCKECHELVWCDGICCFDSSKGQRDDFFKQHDNQIRSATLKDVKTKLSKLKSAYPTGAGFVWWLVIEEALKELRSKEQP